MVVLIAVCFALCVSLTLRALRDAFQLDFGNSWPIIEFAALLIAHGMAGIASWNFGTVPEGRDEKDGQPGWGDRLMWMAAIHVHVVTYALNWPVYQGITGTTELMKTLLPPMTAILLVIVPSILMFGGPVASIMRPRSRRRG